MADTDPIYKEKYEYINNTNIRLCPLFKCDASGMGLIVHNPIPFKYGSIYTIRIQYEKKWEFYDTYNEIENT